MRVMKTSSLIMYGETAFTPKYKRTQSLRQFADVQVLCYHHL